MYLFVFEASANIAELLIDAEALLLFVLAIPNVADENREASHAGQSHGRSDPTPARLVSAPPDRTGLYGGGI